MDASAISIYAEPTPNPMTMKLVSNRTLLEHGSADFPDEASADQSPLAAKLFNIPGVTGIFIAANFVTLTRNGEGAWNNILDLAIDGLRTHLQSGEPTVRGGFQTHQGDDSELAEKIKRVLDTEIRPAVAMDGGDITFIGYADGVVMLKMIGSCSGCPSSTMTLKMGIERRLQEEFPEVEAVEAV